MINYMVEMKIRLLYTVFTLFCALASTGAEVRRITLDEAILIARTRSVDAAVALNTLRSAYWEYRTFRAGLLPEVTFKATVPSYSKQYSSYQNSDGSYSFVHNDNLSMSGSLLLEQRIWLTGGTIAVSSSLDFMRQLSGTVGNRYMSVPVALRLTQPIFGVNDVKWNRRIEPVRYREAKANFISASEDVALTAIQYYFNLLSSRQNEASALQNVSNAEKLYEVALAKRKMGRISDNDVLQIELNLLNSRSTLTSYESQVKSDMFRLRTFLDLDTTVVIEPEIPHDTPHAKVIFDEALAYAVDNNAFVDNIRRRQLEADYQVAAAKGAQRQISLFAQVGYTGTGRNFHGAYDPLNDNQVVEIGMSIPILDWGKRRGRVKVAESNRELVRSRLRKERAEFSENLYILVERFNNQQEQLAIALRADEIATKRYDSSVETFMIGKISALDLNDSQTSKDSARLKYLSELFSFWYYYYQLRSLTLWDFATNSPINADIEKVLNM